MFDPYILSMGIFDAIFGKTNKPAEPSRDLLWPGFKSFTEYNPIFSSFRGAIYEQELTRAAIERFANACAKLEPEIQGNPGRSIERMVKTRPNKFTTWPAFLSRVATLYECDATVCIVPVFKNNSEEIVGIQALKFDTVEVLDIPGLACIPLASVPVFHFVSVLCEAPAFPAAAAQQGPRSSAFFPPPPDLSQMCIMRV